ncbi:hypothetical protein C0989_011748 [Termitomyces sp. Mn162]|nr:hypothetical protein C0989_011748 [Termitomyces sp. Mn162]KAH0582334.1 hypothetical protein H2248_010280 [Termitomyces sp. 'cryptogamus']
MYKTKDQLVCSQWMNTCSLALIKKVTQIIKNAQKKYKGVCATLLILGAALAKVGWEEELWELSDDDIWGITLLEDNQAEGLWVLSWICLMSNRSAIEGEGKQEALHIEWCKSQAQPHWFQEE